MNAVVQVQHLVKRFGNLTAVDDVSFAVYQGEIFGILGPNGAGKTTTLETIEGLQTPTAGRTLVLGVDTHRDPAQVKEHIGVQLQASAYFNYLTLTEILALFGRFYRRCVPPLELLEKMGLLDKRDVHLKKLSGGQKQRFTVAATLVNDPEVVFLDEPTTGLDPQARRNLWDLIQQIHAEGKTIILTTHYMEEAQFLCDRVAIMDSGRIVALDTPLNLVRGLNRPYRLTLVTSSPVSVQELSGLAQGDPVTAADGTYHLQVSNAARALSSVMEWASSHLVTLEHIEVVPATLEDVFLELTGKELQEE